MSLLVPDEGILEMLGRFNITCDPLYARRYCVTARVMGSGSFGKVFAAYRAVTHTDWIRVAVKEITIPSTKGTEEVVRRIEAVGREGALMYNSNSTHVVTVFRPWFEVARGTLCIPQELCDESLEVFRLRHSRQGIPLDVLHTIFFQCLELLHDLTRADIVHNDIKPANILLVWDRGPDIGLPRVKLTDFGLACPSVEITNLTQPKPLGTPYFMAPECYTLLGRRVPHARDMWSMGCLFHLLLTGQYPFLGADRSAVRQSACVAAVTPFTQLPTLDPTHRFLYCLTRAVFTPDPATRPTADQLRSILLSQAAAFPSPVLRSAAVSVLRRMVVCHAQQPVAVYRCPERHAANLTGETIPTGFSDVFVADAATSESRLPRSLSPLPQRRTRRRGGRGRRATGHGATLPPPCAGCKMQWYRIVYPCDGYCLAFVRGHPTMHLFEDASRHSCAPANGGASAMSPSQRGITIASPEAPSLGSTPHPPTPYNPKVRKSLFKSLFKKMDAD